jgi:hypothetical protein
MSLPRVKEVEDYVERLYETVQKTAQGEEAKLIAQDLTSTIGTSITEKDIGKVLHIYF